MSKTTNNFTNALIKAAKALLKEHKVTSLPIPKDAKIAKLINCNRIKLDEYGTLYTYDTILDKFYPVTQDEFSTPLLYIYMVEDIYKALNDEEEIKDIDEYMTELLTE